MNMNLCIMNINAKCVFTLYNNYIYSCQLARFNNIFFFNNNYVIYETK